MTTTLKKLFHGQPSVAGQVLYTCPAGTTAIVLARAIANPSSAALSVRMGLVPSGATADGTHYLLADYRVPGNDSYESDLKVVLTAGDMLEGQSASLPAPSGFSALALTSGGTLAAATYYYKITAINAAGETVGSGEVTATTTGSTGSVNLSWARSLGATGYKLYRSTSTGAQVLLTTVTGGTTVTYTDSGAATPAGATPPSTGSAAACVFTISGVELA